MMQHMYMLHRYNFVFQIWKVSEKLEFFVVSVPPPPPTVNLSHEVAS